MAYEYEHKKYVMTDNDGCEYYLRVVERSLLEENSVELIFYLDRTQRGSDYIQYKISVDGEYKPFLSEDISSYSTLLTSETLPLSEDGQGRFNIEFQLYADYLDLFYIWRAKETVSMTITATQIHNDSPYIAVNLITCDRYGSNALVSFTASHDWYVLSEIKFTLKGLTEEQSAARPSASERTANADGTFNLIYKKSENLSMVTGMDIDLDSENDKAPLDSGKSYTYEIYAKAENGKTAVINGLLNVAQKVTGISCEEKLELILGQTQQFDYIISPLNAEEQSVSFSSNDPEIAEIDNNGLITAKAEGACQIIVETYDGGFVAECYVNVLGSLTFPKLTEVVDYLSVNYFSKINFAADFIKNEFEERGISVEDFENSTPIGKNHPVTKIKSLFEAMESNCQKLRAAAVSNGFEIVSISDNPLTISEENYNWIIVVNRWISFLNELHKKMNGGN